MFLAFIASVAPCAASVDGRAAAVPFPMSSVTLTGDWKHAQDANQEVGDRGASSSVDPPPTPRCSRPCSVPRC